MGRLRDWTPYKERIGYPPPPSSVPVFLVFNNGRQSANTFNHMAISRNSTRANDVNIMYWLCGPRLLWKDSLFLASIVICFCSSIKYIFVMILIVTGLCTVMLWLMLCSVALSCSFFYFYFLANSHLQKVREELDEAFSEGRFSWENRFPHDCATLLKQFLRLVNLVCFRGNLP